jgi:putative membrane protein
MLVAAGIYQWFIDAVAEVTTLRFRRRSLLVLGVVGLSAAAVIVLLAGPVKSLVVHHRWVMYSLFIGLTLGGVPMVWRMIHRFGWRVVVAAVCGLAGMVALALVQGSRVGAGESTQGVAVLFVAGVLAASAMILPGVSGGYLLLVLGAYVPILSAIDALKGAVSARDFAAMVDPSLHVVLPVGLGVVLGVVAVSNVLKWLLHRFRDPTLGVLLGLLFGAVAGLWPFQRGVPPRVGETFAGRVVTREMLAELSPERYPTELFTPELWQVFASVGLVVVGFAVTTLIGRLGRERKPAA